MARVLVVDDIPDNVKLLTFCLEDEGYEIVPATNGKEALTAARDCDPDCILLDVMMPGLDGVAVTERLRDDPDTAQIPIILVTALSDEDDVIRGLDAGADDYVTKPYNSRVIAARTRAAVHRHMIIRENRRLIDQLEWAAKTDSLTNLLNRRSFFELFEYEIKQLVRSRTQLSLVMVDVDHFKHVNDQHGHLAGDEALRQVANSLREGSRDSDVVGRYGGEEFCALLPDTDEEGARIWAERRREAIEQLQVQFDNVQIPITASFGISTAAGGETVTQITNDADIALLDAKSAGRNRVLSAAPVAH
ncbi:MAG: diguanylate cyclase [Pirellulaceae bacterium]|jgi:diguanylate cyclase (GGDEF)-like protein|nr:diguanylate cyclase [Pirellulaceae bacterium]MDP7016419.1 diguanylate cyclase [Pirellulaceae bacterium]